MAVSKKDDYISKRYREGQPGKKFPSFLLTGIIAEELYKQMEPTEQLFYEQKGRGKKKREKKMFIDKMVIKNCKKTLVNLAMDWIDNKKCMI